MTEQPWDRARRLYPDVKALTETDWFEHFQRRPDVFHKLLSDIYTITLSEQMAVRRTGRRPRQSTSNLDELWAMILPSYSTEPFGPTLQKLMGRQSLRQFAAKIPMHHESLARLLNGRRPVVSVRDPIGSMRTLERIAVAAKVHPAYFAEYRRLVVLHLLDSMLNQDPSLSISVIERIAEITRSGDDSDGYSPAGRGGEVPSRDSRRPRGHRARGVSVA